jgi:preprotein translocase subunit Sec61beta
MAAGGKLENLRTQRTLCVMAAWVMAALVAAIHVFAACPE